MYNYHDKFYLLQIVTYSVCSSSQVLLLASVTPGKFFYGKRYF